MHQITEKIFPMKYKAYTLRNIDDIKQLQGLSKDRVNAIRTIATVLPFKVNNYVLDALIDWDNIPDDPVFQLTFPQPGMLPRQDFEHLQSLLKKNAANGEIQQAVRNIQMTLNPHPAGQMELNVPAENNETLRGMQHKYNETVLFFPSHGQTCHAYCTYCFRWVQFVGLEKLKFASKDVDTLIEYISKHPEVTDVLFTGGDPLIMGAKVLRRYIEPLLRERPGNLMSIRIGTKVPAYWPYRFLTDEDSDDLMRLFDEIVNSGINLAVMAHYSHQRELEPVVAQTAVKRILNTGATIRCQAPLIKHVNDDPAIWADMWRKQVKLGAVPYYMFVERDTGAKEYFNISLAEAHRIFTEAFRNVSGLCRTVKGPSMSATPGKVRIDGIADIQGEKVFVLKFIQARDPEWVNRPFFARFDENASWMDHLEPAFGNEKFFFE